MEGNHNSGAKDRSQGDKIGKRIRYLLRKYGPAASIILALVTSVAVLWLRRPVPGVVCETNTDEDDLQRIREGERGVNESRFFVDNQVIVTGLASEVDELLDPARTNLDLIPIRQCNLPYLRELSDRTDADLRYFPFPEDVLGDLMTMRLYHIADGQSEKEVVEKINQEGGGRVAADYNLLVGSSQGVCGNPHSSEGSPFGGSPKPLPEDHTNAAMLFWGQWAFQHVGVGRFLPDELTETTIMHQGEGVIVGVFDTSPFDDEEDGWETVEWVNPAMYTETLTMRVSYPEVVNTIEFTSSNGSAEPDSEVHDDVRDHGLFVAGLVHAVAPASEIRLVRVLNEDGCGDLYLLSEALARFTAEVRAKARREDRPLEGVVINLSLGVHDPEEGVILDACSPEVPENLKGPENAIESLCTALSTAYSEGAVIVAAAGNHPYSKTKAGDDSDNEGDRQPAQIPAAYDFVIGVKASNAEGRAACFSNEGDLFAPGGEGDSDKDCAPNVRGCSGDCDFAVIGPVLSPPQGAAYWPTRYAYWSGTSFSAPLVSGLAALVRQTGLVQGGEGGQQTSPWQDPYLVAKTIDCGVVPQPDGVINVQRTLIKCLP
jgi:hypothetical protein